MSELVIHKYQLPASAGVSQTVPIPEGAVLLSVQAQYDAPMIWAMVNPEALKEWRTFHLVGTGQPMPSGKLTHIGTVQLYEGQLVLHVFEEKP